MTPLSDYTRYETRRQFFAKGKSALGFAALTALMQRAGMTGADASDPAAAMKAVNHFAPKAKRVIYLHMVGGPSQLDLYDYKPKMKDFYDKDLPDSVRNGQRLTGMTSGQARFPIAPSKYAFQQYGQSGMWVSEMLPYTSRMVDDMCFIRSMHTEAINHEPGITLMQTGNQISGRPCLGSWVSYGLGSANSDLPTFVVLVAKPTNTEQIQAISARLWGSGYLPGEHAGVAFRSGVDPILFINNPPGVSASARRNTLDGLKALNEINYQLVGDPETHTRIQQYEMAFRMQTSVPELTDLASEPAATKELYGPDVEKPGSFARSALLARRMAERGVRFVQIYHNNWDHHSNLPGRMSYQCMDVDQPCWGLIQDLKQRGLYDDTLVIKIYSTAWLPHLKSLLTALESVFLAERWVLRLARNVGQPFGLKDGMILRGTPLTESLTFEENGLLFLADVVHGHKTGFFFDQRDNRALAGTLAKDRTVLDVFAYVGAFALYCAQGGAKSILGVDISDPALTTAKQIYALNADKGRIGDVPFETMTGDAFKIMFGMVRQRRQYDMVIIDPPSFASSESDVAGALHAYGQLAEMGAQLLAPGGVFVMASCSSRVSAQEFFGTIIPSAHSVRPDLEEITQTEHALDHPIGFPEGAYLKCWFARDEF